MSAKSHTAELSLAPIPDEPVAPGGRVYECVAGVYVHPAVDPEDLVGFELNPIVEKIKGLGHITLEAVRHSNDPNNQDQKLIHRLYGIELNDFKQAAEITDPVYGQPTHVINSYAGLSEHIRSKVRKEFHDRIANNHPDARIISYETDGIGNIGGHYDAGKKEERDKHSHLQMALNRLALARALGGDQMQILVGTSQGSVNTHRMSMENSFGEPVNGRINHKGNVWVSPALVDPTRSRKVMNNAFALKFGRDVAMELVFRSSPFEVIDAARKIGALSLPRQDIGAIRYQISQLRKGTPEADVAAVVESVPTIAIVGTQDAVGELEMLERLAASPKSQLTVIEVAGHGHELAMKPNKLFGKLGKTAEYCDIFLDAQTKEQQAA